MKNLILLYLCLFVGASLNAQHIPDSVLAAHIRATYPNCIDDQNYLLPPAGTEIQNLHVAHLPIQNYEGVQGLTNLMSLFCSGSWSSNQNPITFPAFPNSLKRFACNYCNWETLPPLPASLEFLDCRYNLLDSLNSLPANLKMIYCSYNQLVHMDALPANLTYLDCGYNQLRTLPNFSENLLWMDCKHNRLDSLPLLNNKLKYLDCSSNPLNNLPTLPSDLEDLYCFGNRLSALPAINNKLINLDCRDNQLTALPILPKTLQVLAADSNQLSVLPRLSHTQLRVLTLTDNPNLSCLPILPMRHFSKRVLRLGQVHNFRLSVQGTNIQCIPNTIPRMVFSDTLPLCLANNPNGCISATFVHGQVYTDFSGDCLYNAQEDSSKPMGVLVQAVDSDNQSFDTYTDPSGKYFFMLEQDTYTIKTAPRPSHLYNVCSIMPVFADTLTDSIRRDVGLLPLIICPYLAVEIDAFFLRRCMQGEYLISCKNYGTAEATQAYIEIQFDNYLNYLSNSANFPVEFLGDNRYRFLIGNIGLTQQRDFRVRVGVSCEPALGYEHCTSVDIYPKSTCGLDWDGAIVEILDTCITDSIVFYLLNSGNNMQATQTYRIAEDNLIYRPLTPFMLNAGDSLRIAVPTRPNRTYWIEVQQAPNYPAMLGDSLAWTIVQNCNGQSNPATAFVNAFYTERAALSQANDCTNNQGAYDPNDKRAQQIGFGDNHEILSNTPLKYKIRFQNTGTDTAFQVVILDTLDAAVLDPTSIEMGTSSHPFVWELLDNQVLKFTFANILLVDSITNEPLSHGFVSFKIQQRPNLPDATQILNSAAIYFDFNLPVITKTCLHTIGAQTLAIADINQGYASEGFKILTFPNPFREQITFRITPLHNQNPSNYTLRIRSLTGQLLSEMENDQPYFLLNKPNYAEGVYIYQLFADEHLITTGKLVHIASE